MKFKIGNIEKYGYELSNEELLELFFNSTISNEERVEVESIIVDRFTHELCKREGETEDDVFARQFGNFVNGKLCNKKKLAEKMCTEHRYLQNEMFKVCLEYIKVLSDNYDKGWFDGRNEWACKTSSMIIDGLKAKNWYI